MLRDDEVLLRRCVQTTSLHGLPGEIILNEYNEKGLERKVLWTAMQKDKKRERKEEKMNTWGKI